MRNSRRINDTLRAIFALIPKEEIRSLGQGEAEEAAGAEEAEAAVEAEDAAEPPELPRGAPQQARPLQEFTR